MYRRIAKIVAHSKWLRFISVSFGAVLLGAIGSGLWDLILLDVFNWVGDLMLNALASVFSSFTDIMYRSVSISPFVAFSIFPYIVLMTTIIALPWVFLVTMRRALSWERGRLIDGEDEDEEEDENIDIDQRIAEIDKERRRGLQVVLPLAILITLFYSSTFYAKAHAYRAAIFVDRSIAILAPHIESGTVLQLTAAFRSIEDASDFYSLEDELRSIADSKSISLPEFESVR